MAERLTENNKIGWVLKLDDPQNEFEARQQLMSKFKLACEKLGKLEDILEKHGIESIEMLEKELKITREIERLKNKEFDLSNSAIVDKDFYKDFTREIEKLETDRDTWKRACELACKDKEFGIVKIINDPVIADLVKKNGSATLIDYFYQQAKKEGEKI